MTAVTETRPGHSSHSTNATYRQQRGTAAKGAGANEEHIRPRAGRYRRAASAFHFQPRPPRKGAGYPDR